MAFVTEHGQIIVPRGTNEKRTSRKLSPAEREEMEVAKSLAMTHMVERGRTLRAIGKIFNCDPSTVLRRVRAVPDEVYFSVDLSDFVVMDRAIMMRRMKKQGRTLEYIGMFFGCSRTTVWKILNARQDR